MLYEIEDYFDTLNDEYELIENEYLGTELYNEIIHCLDWLFPQWKSNRGLGTGVPEFVMTVIYQTQEMVEIENQLRGLEAIYAEILDAYPTSQKFYFEQFKERCDWAVVHMSEDEFLDFYGKEEEVCSDEEIDEAFNMYFNSHLNLIPFDFNF